MASTVSPARSPWWNRSGIFPARFVPVGLPGTRAQTPDPAPQNMRHRCSKAFVAEVRHD
jgi:hypothetical protein